MEIAAARSLVQVISSVVRSLRDEHSGGLSASSVSTLRRLSVTGPCRLTRLAAAETSSQPAMTQLVQRLEAAGLVTRTTDPDDRRGIQIAITGEGRDLLDRQEREHVAVMSALLATLDTADRARIMDALPALTRLAEAATRPT